MLKLGDIMETMKILVDGKEEDFVVKLEDFEKEDDLLLLSKEIENTELEDTVDLSEYLSNTMEILNGTNK
jgi:hypothetical protein